MTKRIASLMLVVVLVVMVCGTASHAKASPSDETQPAERTSSSSGADKQANEKLRTAFDKLLEDAKAGKLAPAARPQIQQRNSNHLSKGTKIAIGVGIAVAVVAIIVLANTGSGPSDPIRIF
jgi:hypothetical protein